MCGVRCILKTGVKVRSTCNKEIGSRLFWGSYLHKREEIASCGQGTDAVGEFGRECCWRVRERVLSVGERVVGRAFCR